MRKERVEKCGGEDTMTMMKVQAENRRESKVTMRDKIREKERERMEGAIGPILVPNTCPQLFLLLEPCL